MNRMLGLDIDNHFPTDGIITNAEILDIPKIEGHSIHDCTFKGRTCTKLIKSSLVNIVSESIDISYCQIEGNIIAKNHLYIDSSKFAFPLDVKLSGRCIDIRNSHVGRNVQFDSFEELYFKDCSIEGIDLDRFKDKEIKLVNCVLNKVTLPENAILEKVRDAKEYGIGIDKENIIPCFAPIDPYFNGLYWIFGEDNSEYRQKCTVFAIDEKYKNNYGNLANIPIPAMKKITGTLIRQGKFIGMDFHFNIKTNWYGDEREFNYIMPIAWHCCNYNSERYLFFIPDIKGVKVYGDIYSYNFTHQQEEPYCINSTVSSNVAIYYKEIKD